MTLANTIAWIPREQRVKHPIGLRVAKDKNSINIDLHVDADTFKKLSKELIVTEQVGYDPKDPAKDSRWITVVAEVSIWESKSE